MYANTARGKDRYRERTGNGSTSQTNVQTDFQKRAMFNFFANKLNSILIVLCVNFKRLHNCHRKPKELSAGRHPKSVCENASKFVSPVAMISSFNTTFQML